MFHDINPKTLKTFENFRKFNGNWPNFLPAESFQIACYLQSKQKPMCLHVCK